MYWTKLLNWEVLSEEGRKHIAEHKYKPGVYTPLDNVLNPFWFQLTELLPRRLAPNLVTFAGFLPLVLCYGLCWYHSPDYDTPLPRWMYLTLAVSLWWYQTLDAMDGKQARRIKESSPLGQLFDHGCDCMACLSHHSMAGVLFLPGGSKLVLAGLAALQTGFFMAQWQEHYLGVLYTSFGPVGVTETQYGLIALGLLGACAGPSGVAAFVQGTSAFGMSMGSVAIVGWVVFCLLLITICFCNVMSNTPATDYSTSRLRAVIDLLPVVALNLLLHFGWHPELISGVPRLLCFNAGLLFFYFTAQMIIFSMAHMPFNPLQPMLVPFAVLALASRLAHLPFELYVVKVTLVIFTTAFALYVLAWLVTVIDEIKSELGISIFFVTKKPE